MVWLLLLIPPVLFFVGLHRLAVLAAVGAIALIYQSLGSPGFGPRPLGPGVRLNMEHRSPQLTEARLKAYLAGYAEMEAAKVDQNNTGKDAQGRVLTDRVAVKHGFKDYFDFAFFGNDVRSFTSARQNPADEALLKKYTADLARVGIVIPE